MISVEPYNEEQHSDRIKRMLLREADEQELLASSGLNVAKGLMDSVKQSDIVCHVYLNGDNIIALSGASHTDVVGFASVWALGTNDTLRYWNEIEPLFSVHVHAVLDEPGIVLIGNKIDMRNKAHIRWLQQLHFTFTGAYVEHGGQKFEIFYKGE